MRVATDGGCHPNPGGPGGWAWVAEDGRYGCGSFASGTNNVAELTAMKEALLAFPDEPLTIEYDSQYAANCIKDWGPKWRKRGERDKANIDLVFSILGIVDERSHPITWEWVRGHDAANSHPLNTAADELATRMRKVGRESRENGVMEIDTSPRASVESGRARTAKPSRSRQNPKPANTSADEWGNMTAIGSGLDMTAREVGTFLRDQGLAEKSEPTEHAVSIGAAKWFTRRRDKVQYPRWNVAMISDLIRASRG